MAESIHEPDAVLPLVRTRRIEVLDRHDRVRLVIGEQPGEGPHGLPVFAITLNAPSGSVHADLVEDACGVRLAFLSSGNVVLELGADDVNTLIADDGGDCLAYARAGSDHSEASCPGAYLVLCDSDGGTAHGWRVAPDGGVQRLRPRR